MTEKCMTRGCFNCNNRKDVDKIHYKCTEEKSTPNRDDPEHEHGFGHIIDIERPIKGNGGHLFFCGCSCEYWNPQYVKVEFT